MAWEEGYHCKRPKDNEVEKLFQVQGDLLPEEAREWFFTFCKHNPDFLFNLLTGVRLYPIQTLILKSYWNKDFILTVAGRGFSKTFSAAAFIVIYAILNPGSKIGICSSGFRNSKNIFKQIETWINSKDEKGNPVLLKKEVTREPTHESDSWSMEIAGSIIKAIPLTEKTRGERFNLMILDEFLMIPDEIMKTVIMPFLSVEQDAQFRTQIRKAQDELIKKGKMKESERKEFMNNKIIALSSATRKSESLYKKYESYIKSICTPKAKNVNHCVWRLSYEAAPEGLSNISNVMEAKKSMSEAQFNREYRALFTDDSGGFYDYNKIQAAMVPVGGEPSIRVIGDPKKAYIIGIDPNFHESETSDNFTMCVLEVDEETEVGTVVHSYALAKSDIKKRVLYLKYLMEYFNVVYIVVDHAHGPRFIETANTIWKEMGSDLNLSIIPSDYRTDADVKESRRAYNKNAGRIVHSQVFNQLGWKREANDAMQADIEFKKLMFGAPLVEGNRSLAMHTSIPIHDIYFNNIEYEKNQMEEKQWEFIDRLNEMNQLTIEELRMIDYNGGDFNIPKELRGDGATRVRRDSYTALLLANWGRRCYFKIMNKEPAAIEFFRPVLV